MQQIIGERQSMANILRSLWMYVALLSIVATMLSQIGHAAVGPTHLPKNPQQTLKTTEHYELYQASKYIINNNCTAALQHLSNAKDKNPTSMIAYYNQGNCYTELAKQATDLPTFQQHITKAEQAYKRVQLLDPTLTIVYFKLGKLALSMGDNNKAAKVYKQGITHNPDNAALYFNAAGAYDSDENYNDAIIYYLKALEKDPTFIYAYNNLGLAYEVLEEYDKAENAYKNALDIDPDYAFARLNLGNLLAQQQKLKAAKEHYLKVLKISPDNPWAYLYLGNVYYQQNENLKALEAYDTAQKLNPGYAPLYYLKALTFQKMDKAPEALAASLSYLSLSPQGKHAKEMLLLVQKIKIHQAQANIETIQLNNCAPTEKVCHLK